MWQRSAPRVRSDRRALGAASPDDDELELLRAALLPGDDARAAWTRWRATHDVDEASDRSYDVLPSIGATLPAVALGADQVRLRSLRSRNWVRNESLLRSLAAALDLLGEEGVPTLVVKGAILVSQVYGEPGLRRMGDTDLVVGPDYSDRAVELLTTSGWRVKSRWIHATDLVDVQGHGLDVHRWPLFPRFTRRVESGWLDRCRQCVIAGAPTRRLALPDELVLTVTHGLFAMPSRSMVRWPLDVAAILGSADHAEFWPDVVRSADELQLGPIVAKGLGFCRQELALDVPPDILEGLRATRLDRWIAYQWWRRVRGSYPPMRIRRYVDLERAAGRRPTATGYATRRWDNLRRHGSAKVLQHRLRNLRTWGFRPE